MTDCFESGEAYARITRLGLTSALKSDDFYLTRLPGDRLESVGQCYARLAATVATHRSCARREYAIVLGLDPFRWKDIFAAFFLKCSANTFSYRPPRLFFLWVKKICSLSSSFLLNRPHGTTRDAIRSAASFVVPVLAKRGGVALDVQDYNLPPYEKRKLGRLGLCKLLDSAVLLSNSDADRPTGVCLYVEPWHSDVESFLSMKGLTATHPTFRFSPRDYLNP